MIELADYGLEHLRPGTRIKTRKGRRVAIGAPLGGGNEGVVLHGECSGERVAVKILKPDAAGVRAPRTQFLVDSAISERVDPRIAAPYDSFELDGRVGHISRLVPGETVAELADNPARLNPRQRLKAAIKLGGLLAKLHASHAAFGDLNKGAVMLDPRGDTDVEVYMVDLDSAVIRGAPLPPTLGAPDTAAAELRRGEQPRTVSAWQRADWSAYGHVTTDLLLNKTASCGIEDPDLQINAFLGIPPFLRNTPEAERIDAAAGLPTTTLPHQLRDLLRRLFDHNPDARDGLAFLSALAGEFLNNHQVTCPGCGGYFLTHEQLVSCPLCGHAAAALKLVLPKGRTLALDRPLLVGRELLGGSSFVSRQHARVFRLGPVVFVSALSPTNRTELLRGSQTMVLSPAVHVPLLPGDRLRLGAANYIETLVMAR